MGGRLAARRILIVEDEFYVASDIRRALEAEGAVVVGPIGLLDKGLALASGEPLDAAVLDVNLGDTMTYPIADQLQLSGVRWVFVTGYDEWSMPAAYRHAPRLSKPFTIAHVVEALVGLINGRTAS